MIRKLLVLGFIIAVSSQTMNSFDNSTTMRFPLGSAMLNLLRHAFSCTRLKCPGPYFVVGHYALDEPTPYEDLQIYHNSSFKDQCPGITMYHILYFGACLRPCNSTADCAVIVGSNPSESPGWHCCPVRDIVLDNRVELRCIPFTAEY